MREPNGKARTWSHWLGAHALALRAIDGRLRAAGQGPLAWYDALLELERAGGRLRVGALGERLVIEPYNATRLVDRLTAKGLVRRSKDPDDGRVAVAVLTDKGAAFRAAMWPHYSKAIDAVLSSLDERDDEAIVRAMKKLIADLGGGKA